MKRILFTLVFVVSMMTDNVTLAQQSYPMLMSVQPVAAQAGVTSEHVVKSRYTMEDAYEVIVSGEGVRGEVVLPKKSEDQKKTALQSLTVKFHVHAEAVPGVRDYRIATPTGISTTGQLVIVRDKVIVESADNNSVETATPVDLPATICGRIEKAEDVDFYKFRAEAGEEITFHVRCMRLQDRIHDLQQHADPLMTIRNSTGSTIAAADNVFAGDPFIAHRFAETGEYYLELRDVRFQGNQYWEYCVEVHSRPFVQTVFPLAINSTNVGALQLIGSSVGQNPKGFIRNSLENVSPGIKNLLVVPDGGSKAHPVEMVLTTQSPELEQDAVNNSIEQAQTLTLPGGVNGRIEAKGDVDYFRFRATKGQKFDFEVLANRASSPLDPHLRIVNEQGNQLQLNDDTRIGKRNFADARIENWTVPADGIYAAEVRDVNLRGGPPFVYYLTARVSEPSFNLFADTDKTPLAPGTSGVIYVRAEKKNGFDGEIRLGVDSLPPGVKATAGKILPGKSADGCIVLSASPDAKPMASPIRIFGTATIDDRDVTTDATIYQETYQPGGGRGHWPVESHVVSIGTAGDIHSIKLNTNKLLLKPGGKATIEVEIERAEGFDKNVTLEVVYKHLNTIYGNPLPAGVTVDKSASKVLLTAGATQGTIVLQADPSVAKVSSQVITVMANVSINFVMKATYASDPILVSVVGDP